MTAANSVRLLVLAGDFVRRHDRLAAERRSSLPNSIATVRVAACGDRSAAFTWNTVCGPVDAVSS
jgi:hypothetical protein